MRRLNVSEARRRLPALAAQVASLREEIVITRRGRPVAKLVPCGPAEGERPARPLRGVPIEVAEDFDEPLPELWEALGR